MPYRDKEKDRRWHREHMRNKRTVRKKMLAQRYGYPFKIPKVDAEGYVIPDE